MKKRTFTEYISLFLLTIGIASCTNLDEKVFSSVTEETYNYTVNDFGPNIAGAYAALNYGYVGTYWQTQELTGCCISIPCKQAVGMTEVFINVCIHNWNSELGQILDLWNNLLYRCNLV